MNMKDPDQEIRYLALVQAQKHSVDTWDVSKPPPSAQDVTAMADTFYKFLIKGRRP